MRLTVIGPWVVLGAVLTTACGGAPEAEPALGTTQAAYSAPVSACTKAAIRAGAPASAQGMLDRAYTWLGVVPYCQCKKPGSSGYRADCSGYVSFIWQLPKPGNTTYQFPGGPSDNGRAKAITWSDLTVGDALNFGGNHSAGTGHVMLFAGWLNSAHTKLCSIEETHPGTTAHIGKHKLGDPGSWWGGTGTFKDIFQPIRKTGYTPSGQPAGSDAGPDAAPGTDAGPDGAPGTGGGSGASGGAGMGGTSGGWNSGGAAGSNGGAAQTGSEHSSTQSNASGSCSVPDGHGSAPTAPLWLVAGVLALAAERRRRR